MILQSIERPDLFFSQNAVHCDQTESPSETRGNDLVTRLRSL